MNNIFRIANTHYRAKHAHTQWTKKVHETFSSKIHHCFHCQTVINSYLPHVISIHFCLYNFIVFVFASVYLCGVVRMNSKAMECFLPEVQSSPNQWCEYKFCCWLYWELKLSLDNKSSIDYTTDFCSFTISIQFCVRLELISSILLKEMFDLYWKQISTTHKDASFFFVLTTKH